MPVLGAALVTGAVTITGLASPATTSIDNGISTDCAAAAGVPGRFGSPMGFGSAGSGEGAGKAERPTTTGLDPPLPVDAVPAVRTPEGLRGLPIPLFSAPSTSTSGDLLPAATLGTPECPFDFDSTEPEELDPDAPSDPVVSAKATAGRDAIAAPTPSATANAPTRPT